MAVVETMDEVELASFSIIAAVGSARSSYIEAMHRAREGKFDEAEQLIHEGNEEFGKGHDAHMALIQKEASGQETKMMLILTHAEDQLMSAEGFRIVAEEFIDLYRHLASGSHW